MGDGPRVVSDPAICSGEPTVKAIDVETVADAMWHQGDAGEVEREYGLTRGDVVVACWYIGTYGSRAWRFRWGTWAATVHPMLWRRTAPTAVPLPPCKDGVAP